MTFAPVCLQVMFLFDSAVSFDDQHILEKLSASCVRCAHVRLSAHPVGNDPSERLARLRHWASLVEGLRHR